MSPARLARTIQSLDHDLPMSEARRIDQTRYHGWKRPGRNTTGDSMAKVAKITLNLGDLMKYIGSVRMVTYLVPIEARRDNRLGTSFEFSEYKSDQKNKAIMTASL